MGSMNLRRTLGGATALGAALALAGGGLATASTESATGTLDGGSGSANYSEHTEYGMTGWDDCPFEEILTFREDGTAMPSPNTCITLVVREGNLKLGGIDVEMEPNSMMVTGGFNTQTRAWKPEDGSLHASPVTVPDGALGIGSEESGLLGITAYVEQAGTVDFNNDLADMWMNLPIKLRLSNPLLGNNCYIGSDENPIDLTLQIDPETLGGMQTPIAGDDGNEYIGFNYPAAEASDTEFAVPGATGCGPLGIMNGIVNLRAGLPSPAGNNSIDVTTSFNNGSAFQIWNQSLGD